VDYASKHVLESATPEEVHNFIESLPERAQAEMHRLGINGKPEFTRTELDDWLENSGTQFSYGNSEKKGKIFGLGLSRTGTRSLTSALQVMGFDCSHYPIDEDTYVELSNGQYDLTLLKYHDGLTDITTVPFYEQFDKLYPGSKFILTVRDEESWLGSCSTHWFNRPAFKDTNDPDEEVHLRMRQFLRSSVFGCYNFIPKRFIWVYERHLRDVQAYFKDRPEDLLIINVCSGEGYEKLAPFLERPIPAQPFPHKGNVLSRNKAAAAAVAKAAQVA
jgi:hypothetical protein